MNPRYIGVYIPIYIYIQWKIYVKILFKPFVFVKLSVDCETWDVKGHDDSHDCQILQHVRGPEKSCHVFTVRSENHHVTISRLSRWKFLQRSERITNLFSKITNQMIHNCRVPWSQSWLFIRPTKWIYWLLDWSTGPLFASDLHHRRLWGCIAAGSSAGAE